MKKLFFLFLLLPLSLFASKILSYNIYDRTDRADVMITFDTPYEGVIKQSTSSTQIIIKLEDAQIESPKVKKTTSKYLYSLSITPMKGYTQIIASIPSFVKLQASKTSDSYGLRLRFIDKNTLKPKQQQQTSASTNPFANLPTKKDNGVSTSYYIVVSILIVGILILLYLKKKMAHAPTQNKQKPNSWLFSNSNKNTPIKADASMKDLNQDNVSIRFQKPLNENSSVVMLDFGQQSYLILMGENNILLDKFTDDKPVTNDDFEQILRSRHQELDEFLQVENEPKEPLQSYKEKASSISFDA